MASRSLRRLLMVSGLTNPTVTIHTYQQSGRQPAW